MRKKIDRTTYESYHIMDRMMIELALSDNNFDDIIKLTWILRKIVLSEKTQSTLFYIGEQIFSERKGWA